MLHKKIMNQHQIIGRFAALAVSFLGVAYAIALVLGLLSLKSSQDTISDPIFTILELIILLMAPLLVISMVSVHAYASPDVKVYSLTALVFMILLAGITSSVHFVILTVSHQIEATELTGVSLLLSFKWPSVAYALDILAWDWFFALSMLFAAPVFKEGRLETSVRILMIITGVLSLVGLIGVPLANMQVRMIGVIGYAGLSPIVFLLLGIVFSRSQVSNDIRIKK
jgi:hypothetical protein